MIKKILILLLVFSTGIFSKFSYASHVSGGEVTYSYVGPNQYQVNLILYWDCGSFDPGTTQSMTATNSCGLASVPFTVNLDTAYEISQICPSSLGQTTCGTGTLPGNKKNVYSAIVTLPGACSLWTFEHTSCCRNTSTNVPSQPSYTFYATLNNVAAPANNSPFFTSQPLPYFCVNQPVCFSPGVVEQDGNTLTFSFVSAMDVNSTTPVVYAAGYSATSPMPGITINPLTGLISFTPTMQGNFVVSFLVTETNSSGVVVGSVIRDIQMIVVNCTNQVISCNSGTLTNLVGVGATQTGPNSMQICENIPFTFQATFSDPDVADVLSITSNIAQVLPGAIITTSGTNPITMMVSWTAPPGSANTNTTFAVTVADNACPVTGQQTINYLIDVLSAANAGPDQLKCGNQGVTLNSVGPGTTFTWSVLSGPPIVVGSNFSCNPCQNPVASPSATTTYLLTCGGGNGCVINDTVTVFVVPNFTFNVTQSGTSSCLLQPIQLGIANLSPNVAGYTYSWSPATYLSSSTIANPVANITAPGTYTYTVSVTSPQGCIKTDNVTISVIPAVSPTITAHADTSFCAGGTASLGVTFGNGVPAVCGPSVTGACAVSIPTTVGTGTLATNAYPTPFTGFWNNGRMQVLFTAAELNALGFVGGKITSVALDVASKASTQPYNGFTIKMGCTNLSSLPAGAFQSVATTVFGPTAVTTTAGWNTYNFTTVYEWDGISNLIVEMCYNNTSWTSNDILNKTATTFNSTILEYQDPNPGCGLSAATIYTERPNMKFQTCAVAANPSNYSYLWTPSAGSIANASAQNTTAQPMTTTTFTVTVTDIAGGCSSTDSVLVNVTNINTLAITPAGPFCVNGGTQQLAVNVPMSSGSWSGPGVNASSGVFNPATAGAGSHQIIFAVNGACGVGADTITIVVTPQPDATITPVGNQCSTGSAITLAAATAGGTWSGQGITNASAGTFDPATAGVGSWTITYNITTPCNAQDTVIITVTSQLDATITHVGPFCTAASSVTLAAADPGGVWSGTGITNTTTGTFDPATAGPGQHVITYTISGLCGNTDTDTIVVIASPVISFTADTTEGCEPTTITFTSTVNQPGGSCLWTFGNGATSTNCNPSYEYLLAGTYDVSFTYTNTIGCVSSITSTGLVTIHSQPLAQYTAFPQPTTIVDPTVHFTDQSLGVIDAWSWTFGFVGTSNQQNPTFVFPDTGYYPIQLIVTNVNGCADTINGNVMVDPIQVLYAPNAFTPNGNGKNDEFRVYGDGIDFSTFEMKIYNRWGEQIFQSNDYNVGWKGSINNTGDVVQEDVYVWRVTFKDFSGASKKYIGHVTIVK